MTCLHFHIRAPCPICEVPACICALNEACADLIITDLNVPFVKGLAFLEEQKVKGCRVQNLALMTGKLKDEDRARAAELSVSGYSRSHSVLQT